MQIAIVDDDKKETEYLRTALGSMLCGTVHTYQSGEAFLSAFSAGKYELIVLDIFMSGITGMDVARKIRETDKTARIVFCTSSNEFASESYEVGASYYLHKPLSEERLRAMLDRLNFSEMELMRPKNTLFLFAINIGAILIYYIVTQLILEQDKTLALTEQNHQLSMQAIQYENLQERITEARRAKHDVRHHIALMQEYLNHKDYTALEDYLRQYGKSLPDDTLIRFCANPAANAVLLYFAQQAKNNGIDYIVKTEIPAELGIPETDISVILGNLLENAIEACRAETGEHKKRVT